MRLTHKCRDREHATVFISSLPEDVQENELVNLFKDVCYIDFLFDPLIYFEHSVALFEK